MEKNKRKFSLRAYPGREGRKWKQGINARKVYHVLGILLAAAVVFQTMTFDSEAAGGSSGTFVYEMCKGGTDGTLEDHTDNNGINDRDFENQGTENENEGKEPGDGQEECICPVEELIAALPDAADIRSDNADEVQAQLEEILALYRELTEDEQGQLDLSRCYDLQEALDAAKAPVTAEEIPADAVAKIEKEGAETVYVTADKLNDAFSNSSYAGATFTLLADVTRTGQEYLLIRIDCILDLGGHTISGNLDGSDYILHVNAKTNVTIQGDGGISGTGDTKVLNIGGNVIIKGGTFSCASGNCIFVTGFNASLSIANSEVRVESTGGCGLCIGNASSSVQLSAGTYSGEAGAIFINGNNSFTLSGLLDQTGQNRLAYYQGSTLITEGLDGKALPGGTYTVEECKHDYKYTHTNTTRLPQAEMLRLRRRRSR